MPAPFIGQTPARRQSPFTPPQRPAFMPTTRSALRCGAVCAGWSDLHRISAVPHQWTSDDEQHRGKKSGLRRAGSRRVIFIPTSGPPLRLPVRTHSRITQSGCTHSHTWLNIPVAIHQQRPHPHHLSEHATKLKRNPNHSSGHHLRPLWEKRWFELHIGRAL